jgi:exonuclease III
MEELVHGLNESRVFAASLQETWIVGDKVLEHDRYTIINHGPPVKLCSRGSLGVAIALDPSAKKAWESAGCTVLYFGIRIIAVRLKVTSFKGKKKEADIYLVSAYAPDSGKSRQEHDEYNAHLQRCFDSCGDDEVLIMGTDANASVGARSKHDDVRAPDRDRVRGHFGSSYTNKAGKELHSLLGINGMCLPSTFFEKREYHTWYNPNSRKGHQIDHFVVKQADAKRVRDAGKVGMHMATDHYPLLLKIRICKVRKLRGKGKGLVPKVRIPCAPPGRIDRHRLKDPETAKEFRKIAKKETDKPRTTSFSTHLIKALTVAGKSALSTNERRQPGWFAAAKATLEPVIKARNAAQAKFDKAPSDETRAKLKETRKSVKRAVAMAEKSWFDKLIQQIEGMGSGSTPVHPAQCWAAIKALKGGKSITKPVVQMSFKDENGVKGKSPEENAAIMKKYLNGVFNKSSVFDQAAIDQVRQRPKHTWRSFDEPPSDEDSPCTHEVGRRQIWCRVQDTSRVLQGARRRL